MPRCCAGTGGGKKIYLPKSGQRLLPENVGARDGTLRSSIMSLPLPIGVEQMKESGEEVVWLMGGVAIEEDLERRQRTLAVMVLGTRPLNSEVENRRSKTGRTSTRTPNMMRVDLKLSHK
jgi:hypothetical protein